MAEEGGKMEGLGRQESGRFHKVAAWQSCTCSHLDEMHEVFPVFQVRVISHSCQDPTYLFVEKDR